MKPQLGRDTLNREKPNSKVAGAGGVQFSFIVHMYSTITNVQSKGNMGQEIERSRSSN